MPGFTQLGWSYDALNPRDTAAPYYQQALTIARSLKDSREEGRLLMDTGQYTPKLEQALALLREGKDRQAEACTLRILGGL